MERPGWLFFPDYRASNPYQSLLAHGLLRREPNAHLGPGTITDALESVTRGQTVFHLHWEDAILAPAADESAARSLAETFSVEMSVFQELGGTVVWTMHNAAPHEDRYPGVSARLRQHLSQRSDVVHVHGSFAARLAAEAGARAERILIVQHPDLSPAYPNDIDDDAARRYFALDQADTVFAFIGAMRGYKGVEILLSAFAEVHRIVPSTQLILAGRAGRGTEARFEHHAPGVRMIPQFIDDAVVQYVLRAADIIVLPYRRILTSGALSLALGFGRPVIVPDLEPLLEVVQPGREALVYRTDDPADLSRVMFLATSMDSPARLAMRRHAARRAAQTNFDDLAAALAGAVMTAAALRPISRRP